MSNSTATTTPTAPVHEIWGSELDATGDYMADCVGFTREALSHVGFSRFEDTPWEDVIACSDGDVPVTVAVMAVPTEGWEMTLEDLESLIDDEVRAKGAAMCIGRALATDGPLPERLRFDVVSACINPEVGRVRVHHVRGAWQS